MHLEMDGSEQHHSHCPARRSSNGGTLHTQLRTAQTSEYQGIVAYDVKHIHNTRHHHGIHHLVSTTQRGRESERQSLEKRQCTCQFQIHHTVAHQFRPQPHQVQQSLSLHVEQSTHDQSQQQVHYQCHAHHLYQSLSQTCTNILCTKDGCTH